MLQDLKPDESTLNQRPLHPQLFCAKLDFKRDRGEGSTFKLLRQTRQTVSLH